jgi:hypothetical protein
MGESPNQRKMAENEVVFRQANEKALKEIEEFNRSARENGDADLVNDSDIRLHFFCECFDENCHERIKLTISQYKKIHRNSSQFAVINGHHNAEIERIVADNGHYLIVEKYLTPPKHVTGLKKTA